jgi:hypothetical protein
VRVLLFATKGAAKGLFWVSSFGLGPPWTFRVCTVPNTKPFRAISFLTTGGAKTKIVKQKWIIENARRTSDVYFTFLEPSGNLLGPFWKG